MYWDCDQSLCLNAKVFFRTYIEASSPSDAAIASDPTPESNVPHTSVVGPPFRKAALIVKLMPVHEDSTVMPNATAGFSERYLCHPVNRYSTIRIRETPGLHRVSEMIFRSLSYSQQFVPYYDRHELL